MTVEEQLREHLRRGIEWLQADGGQDPEAWLTHHGIHGGEWELDGFKFGLSLAGVRGAPILCTTSGMPYPGNGQPQPEMPEEVWAKVKAILLSIGVEVSNEWQHTGQAFSATLSGVQFGQAWRMLQANYGTQFCEECPQRVTKSPDSTFCTCEFIQERSARVVYPDGWS